MARRRRACGSGPNPGGGAQEDWRGTLILRDSSQNVRTSPGVPARPTIHAGVSPCGKGAVPLRLLGRKPLASSTLAPSARRSAGAGPWNGVWNPAGETGLIGMAERGRAYVSGAFARIPRGGRPRIDSGSTPGRGGSAANRRPCGVMSAWPAGTWDRHCSRAAKTVPYALVAQRIERRFPKPGAAGPTPATGTSDAGVNAATRPPEHKGMGWNDGRGWHVFLVPFCMPGQRPHPIIALPARQAGAPRS